MKCAARGWHRLVAVLSAPISCYSPLVIGIPELCGALIAGVALGVATRRPLVGALGAVVAALAFAAFSSEGGDSPVEPPGPELTPREEFVTSQVCRSCHPGEYDGWHRSFHRTMTQIADDVSVLGEFEGSLTTRGVTVDLREHEGRFEARLATPDAPNAVELFLSGEWTPIAMTTGSHHMQAYWVETPDGYYSQLPFMWMIDERRWIPTDDSFIRPHADVLQDYDWLACAQCHATDHSPRQNAGGQLDFRVTELGIACEACHGPGGPHVEANRNPLRRYALHLNDGDDPTVVDPTDLSASLTSQVCGQCHARVLPVDEEYARHLGTTYRAGDPLALHFEAIENDGDQWSDGRWRVAGREWNSMEGSACVTEGSMTCLSCHSMHEYASPADQLSPSATGDGACAQCHANEMAAGSAHTHHDADSEGSRCVNCHMPRTSYALYTAIADHHVASPRAVSAAFSDRPNACNLCHLDRSLAWTGEQLNAWFDTPIPALTDAEQSQATGLLWALSGDAVQRAITAWHLGYAPAIEASGREWMVTVLAWMLDDPYAAVRYVASAALASQGVDADSVDVFADEVDRAGPTIRFVERMEREFGGTGRVDVGRDVVQSLRAERDDTEIWLAE